MTDKEALETVARATRSWANGHEDALLLVEAAARVEQIARERKNEDPMKDPMFL